MKRKGKRDGADRMRNPTSLMPGDLSRGLTLYDLLAGFPGIEEPLNELGGLAVEEGGGGCRRWFGATAFRSLKLGIEKEEPSIRLGLNVFVISALRQKRGDLGNLLLLRLILDRNFKPLRGLQITTLSEPIHSINLK